MPMTDVGRFGVFLPSYIWEGDGPERARGHQGVRPPRRGARASTRLFITDHLLAARRFYSVNWLEPLMALAVAAGATERVRLGTSILIMPLRNPVILAKELATLQFLSDNRVILGAGVGWNDAEYEAVGVHKSERGKRTDEMLDIMMPLLEGETRHLPRRVLLGRRRVHRASDVAAAAALDRRRVAAGRPQVARRAQVRRVGQGAGRSSRRLDPAAHLPAAGHRPRLAGAPGRDAARPARTRATCLVAHENFLHLVLTDDPAKAREEQHRAFLKVMSSERGPKYLESVYLFGTPDEIVASLQARVDAGVEYFFLHTMTPDPDQLQLWVDHIIPNVTFPETVGPVRRPPTAWRR